MNYTGLHNGLREGSFLTQNTGLVDGELRGLIGPDDSRNSGFANEARDLFLSMTTQPDSDRKRYINEFIVGCKRDGNWQRIDALYFLASHDQQAARLNWINPLKYQLTEISSPSWTVDRGYTGNGTSSYLKTGFIPSTNGVNYSANSASIGVYSRTNQARGEVESGTSSVANDISQITLRGGAGNFNSTINSNASATISSSDSRGFHYSYRNSTTFIGRNESNNLASQGNSGVQNLSPNEFYILGRNTAGALASPSSKQISFVCYGTGDIDFILLYRRVQTFLTYLGANV